MVRFKRYIRNGPGTYLTLTPGVLFGTGEAFSAGVVLGAVLGTSTFTGISS